MTIASHKLVELFRNQVMFCSNVRVSTSMHSIRFASTFIEIFLFYTTVNQNERELVTSLVPDTRSINGPRALLR